MGDPFIVYVTLEVTPKVGPNAGKRLMLDEAALFMVCDEKIVKERYFYTRGYDGERLETKITG